MIATVTGASNDAGMTRTRPQFCWLPYYCAPQNLPAGIDWRALKDYCRRVGPVTYTSVNGADGVAECETRAAQPARSVTHASCCEDVT